ncbi:amidase [Paenibacillus sp.]|uniref:amidase n=1 Tax=Paenibacillus sp. TaxID=58172 RepID=UPI0028114E62|nr:amidase [Paenibacillus sp.]
MRDAWNAFFDRGMTLAPTSEGPLSGMRFAAKDIFALRGYVAGAGSPEWRSTHEPAANHAEAVERLLRSGAELIGTTHTDELMYSLNGENYHYGTPLNPKAPRHIPGGSSSGSAVAVAAGEADFALGSDTGGSVRIPASYCGIFGFRPTHGAVPDAGMVPLAPSFDTVGWLARDASALRRVGGALLPAPPEAPTGFRRLLAAEDAFAAADPAVANAARAVLKQVEALREPAVGVTVSEEGLERWMNCFRLLQGSEIWRTHGAWVERVKPRFGPGVAERFAWARTIRPEETEPELELRERIRQRMAALLGGDGILVMPTAPAGPPLRNTVGPELEKRRTATLQMCCAAGLAGLPQLTMPLVEWNGLPVGVSFLAGPGQDARLLAWAESIAPALLPITVST